MAIGEMSGASVVAVAVVIVLFALALRGRSWTLWLAGYGATLVTLLLSWRTW